MANEWYHCCMDNKNLDIVEKIGDKCPIAWIIENQDKVIGRTCNILLGMVDYLRSEAQRLQGSVRESVSKRAMHIKIPADPAVSGDKAAEAFLLRSDYGGYDVKDVLHPDIPRKEGSSRSVLFEKNPKSGVYLKYTR